MKRKIYWNMCLIAFVAIVLSSVMATVIYYRNLERQMKEEVVTEARYIESGMELSGEEYLKVLSGKIRESSRNRITLIAQDGTVLFDNYNTNKVMTNHSDRPEIRSALEKGIGESTRISDTLSEKTYYYAIRLADGNIIRVANTTSSVLTSLLRLIPVMGGVAVLILLLSMALGSSQTRSIVRPINDLDLDHPEETRIYDELAPLIGKVEKQKQTIQKQMDLLKEKQRQFTAITENMSEGFIVVGKRAEVASYNTSAMKILGVDPQFAEEAGVNILNFNRSQIFRQVVDEALAGHHCEQTMDINGRCYQIIANPVMEGDDINGAIIVILDVTEKQEREELRREFSANVSHELKTPLTSISGYAEIMKNGLVKPEDMKHFSENIYQEAQRMIVLIGDIIKLSQLDENQTDLEKRQVDLYQIASSVIERLKSHAKEREVTLKLEGARAVVTGAVQILDEMIYNLCENGIKYNHPDGSVTLIVKEEKESPVIIVKDTGIGIPEADQERIFERFYRVDKSHSQQIDGTGLGLSIVKHGAIYHNARVEMTSREGQGTTIKIIF